MTIRRFSILTGITLMSALVLSLGLAWARDAGPYDQLDLLVDIRHELVEGYVEAPDEQAMIEAAVRGMISALDDPYTVYLPPSDLEQFEANVRGSFTGIGAEVDVHDGRLRIVSPLEDSPAWEAGVLAGDVVLEIEGEDTLGLSLTEAVNRLKGPEDTQVTIRVRHVSGEEQDITITRGVIDVASVRGAYRNDDGEQVYMLDPARGIGYIRLTQFGERTAEEFREAVQQVQAQGARALILDLRFNPGGLLEAAVEISDVFLDAGETVVSVRGRSVREQVHSATDRTIAPDLPLVVLANESSASASEIVTGALRDNERALIVGTRTFGKGSVQQVRGLSPGLGALKMTNAYYYIPSGERIHRTADAERWGVDPSDGSYVPMDVQQIRDMIETRREASIANPLAGRDADEPLDAQWIEQTFDDPQLAAAVTAAAGWLSDGQWPQVGQDNADELVRATEIANLRRRHDMLVETLREIETELQEMGAPVDVAGFDLIDPSNEDIDAVGDDAE
jgi:carboxyl-terminal processing protease